MMQFVDSKDSEVLAYSDVPIRNFSNYLMFNSITNRYQ